MALTVAEEIEELKRKITLLDGDKKAYKESSQWTIRQNKDIISQLRQENKILRANLSKKMKADDDVISEVFHSHNLQPPAELRGVSGEVAVRKFDQTVCEMLKKRNKLQHSRRSREQLLAQLSAQAEAMELERNAIEAAPAGDSEAASQVRQLENRLDKVVVKCSEASHIRKTYEMILEKLQEECLGFDNAIAELEKAISGRKGQLGDLQSMCNDAELAREMARMELNRQEQSMAESRRERERVLGDYRRQADEKKEFKEKVERRLRKSSTHHSSGHMDSSLDSSVQEEQEEKISSYEEALAKIKDTTGVSDILEVVARFLNQGDTRAHLEQLQAEHSQSLAHLQEEKERLQAQFEEMKYSGEAKMSSGQRMLEEFGVHLEEAKKKCVKQYLGISDTLTHVVAGVRRARFIQSRCPSCWHRSRMECSTSQRNCSTSRCLSLMC
jgi:chromosome segregation ATPase